MRTFKTPLRIRMKRQQRYVSDPVHRLAVVNRNRVRSGLKPHSSVEEIPTYSEHTKALARRRIRNADGTFA